MDSYSFDRTFTVHTVSAASGSVIPNQPCAVFTSGAVPDYETWFVQFEAAPQPDSKTTATDNGLKP
jgi:hypothetical protein